MDYENLIERLRGYCQEWEAYRREQYRHDLEDATEALATLQAENAKLRAELAQADREGRCVVLPDPAKVPVLKTGSPVWYVDHENGEIESGKVFIASYKDGKLVGFSVDFDCGDFDEFMGTAWGNCFFGSEKQAEAALRREQDG